MTLKEGSGVAADELKDWANAQLGKMQRLAEVRVIGEMPRNAIGKILKRELQTLCAAQPVA